MSGDLTDAASSFWSRTRNVPLVWGGVSVVVALLPLFRGDEPLPLLAPLGLLGALFSCWLGWRHRRLVVRSVSLGTLRVSWAAVFLISAGVFAASGWVAGHRFGWAQLVLCLALAATAWTHDTE